MNKLPDANAFVLIEKEKKLIWMP